MKSLFILSLISGVVFTLAAGEEFPQNGGDLMLNRLQLHQQLQSNLDQEARQEGSAGGSTKSVAKAVAFSALLPGAGQLYNGSYWKAAAFLAVEAAAWTVFFTYTKKGDDKDAEFKRYADQYWSEYRYWSYVNYLADQRYEETFPDYSAVPYDQTGTLIQDEYGNRYWYLIDENYYRQNEAVVKAQLREIETQFPTGSGFTHHLPGTKTQQYYEMIGKYPKQFGNAWYDADFNATYQDFGQGNITPMNALYATMRDDANQLYKTASYGTMVALVNHLISAIDAGFTARSINRRAMELTYHNRFVVDEYVNMFGLSVGF